MGSHVDTSELLSLEIDFGQAPLAVHEKAKPLVSKTLHDVEGDAKVFAAKDTGTMANSISTDVDADGLGGQVGPTVDYGADVEYGTEPHIIRARDGGKLVFRGRDGGLVFVDEVHHPGTAPQPFMGPAFDRRRPGFEQAAGDLGERFL